MTHSPPIPAGNQSPYPLQEAPHKASNSAPPPGDARIARTPDAPAASIPTIVALAAGVGLAAVAGGLFYAFRTKPKPKGRSRKRKAKAQA